MNTEITNVKKRLYFIQKKKVESNLIYMIKHSVSRMFEYLLEDQDNCNKGFTLQERLYVICGKVFKVEGDG